MSATVSALSDADVQRAGCANDKPLHQLAPSPPALLRQFRCCVRLQVDVEVWLNSTETCSGQCESTQSLLHGLAAEALLLNADTWHRLRVTPHFLFAALEQPCHGEAWCGTHCVNRRHVPSCVPVARAANRRRVHCAFHAGAPSCAGAQVSRADVMPTWACLALC